MKMMLGSEMIALGQPEPRATVDVEEYNLS